MIHKRKRKPKGQYRIDDQEALATLSTHDTRRRKKIEKMSHKKLVVNQVFASGQQFLSLTVCNSYKMKGNDNQKEVFLFVFLIKKMSTMTMIMHRKKMDTHMILISI